MLSNLCKRCEHCKSSLDEALELKENLDQWMGCLSRLLAHLHIRPQTEAFLKQNYPKLLEQLQKYENSEPVPLQPSKLKPQSRRGANNKQSIAMVEPKAAPEASPESSPPRVTVVKVSKNGKEYFRSIPLHNEANVQALGVLSNQSPPQEISGGSREPKLRGDRPGLKDCSMVPVVPPPSSVKLDLNVSNVFIGGVGVNNSITSICPIRQGLFGLAVDNITAVTNLFEVTPCHPPDTFASSIINVVFKEEHEVVITEMGLITIFHKGKLLFASRSRFLHTLTVGEYTMPNYSRGLALKGNRLYYLTDKGTASVIDLGEECKEEALTSVPATMSLAEIAFCTEEHLLGLALQGTVLDITSGNTYTLLCDCIWTSMAAISTGMVISGWNAMKQTHVVQVLAVTPGLKGIQASQYSVASGNYPSMHLVALHDRPLLLSTRLYCTVDVLHLNKSNHKVSLLASKVIRDQPPGPESQLYTLTSIAPKVLYLGLRGGITELSLN